MYIFDINFLLDAITGRSENSKVCSIVLEDCINKGKACISSSSLHNIRYVLQRNYKEHLDKYLEIEKKLKVVKTPSYADLESSFAKEDIEDYIVELSAKSVNGKVLTNDKLFLEKSQLAISPVDYILEDLKEEIKIDFANLKKQYFLYQDELEEEMDKVLNSAAYIMGSAVKELEENLCRFTGAKNAVTCSSGTDALLLAMMALDIKPGDEVITTPFTFIATAETIALLGAKPVFVDIDEQTYNIDASKIEEKITPKTKAIIAVSLYGQPANLDEIRAVIEKVEGRGEKGEGDNNSSTFNLQPSTSIKIIIDGAQSFGATYKGKAEVHYADIYTTSFFPAKPLGCFGDGGAVLTNSDELAEKMRMLRVHGQNRRYHHKYIGLGARMDTLQCAVVNVKLKHYKEDLAKRQEVARKYTERLKAEGRREKGSEWLELDPSTFILLPSTLNNRTSAWAQYSIRVKGEGRREKVQAKLKEAGIPTAVHYPMPLHLQECFAYLGYKEGDFPVAEKISKEIMSLPMNPYLTDEEIEYVAEKLLL